MSVLDSFFDFVKAPGDNMKLCLRCMRIPQSKWPAIYEDLKSRFQPTHDVMLDDKGNIEIKRKP